MILDEATQAKEPEALIPMLGAEQIVLIGDHK
jgi:superfamily I DNA and/or RNA helicase